ISFSSCSQSFFCFTFFSSGFCLAVPLPPATSISLVSQPQPIVMPLQRSQSSPQQFVVNSLFQLQHPCLVELLHTSLSSPKKPFLDRRQLLLSSYLFFPFFFLFLFPLRYCCQSCNRLLLEQLFRAQ